MYESILGVDMHKRESVVCVVGPMGPQRELRRFSHDALGLGEFREFIAAQGGPRLAVVEATRGVRWMLRFLRDAGCEDVRMVDPASVGTRSDVAKTDRRDAWKLASRARTGDLRYCYICSEDEQRVRRLSRTRARLSRERTRMINAIRVILAEHHLEVTATVLWSKKGMEELRQIEAHLSEGARVCMASYRHVLTCLGEEIARLADLVRKACAEESTVVAQRARRLMAEVPSVKELTAMGIAAELGETTRFQNGRQVASYAGLAPTTRASGGHCAHGPLSKRGNPYLRWWLGQMAVRLLATNIHARQWAARHPRLHGNTRRGALARRILVGLWVSLRSGELFDLRRALGLSLIGAPPNALRVR